MAESQLLGCHEVAALLGISRQRVDKISRTDEFFPSPIADLAAGRIWKRDDIFQWATRTGRIAKVQA
jgi:predicted DNA-binding transcriptional regulator AlpA